MRNLSFYASYSTSFVPVAAASQDNFGLNPFKPTEANSIEGGVKAELLGKRLNVSAAYFDIKKKNTLNTLPKSVRSADDGVTSPSMIDISLPRTAMSAGPVAVFNTHSLPMPY